MTRRRNGGSRPRSRRECRSLIAVESSPRMVQQTQPDCSITIVSSIRSSRWWSSPISPNSLINTAVSDSAGSRSSRCNSVVLPEPRNPVINVTGVKSGSASAKLALHQRDQFRVERIAGPAEQPLGGGPEMARDYRRSRSCRWPSTGRTRCPANRQASCRSVSEPGLPPPLASSARVGATPHRCCG